MYVVGVCGRWASPRVMCARGAFSWKGACQIVSPSPLLLGQTRFDQVNPDVPCKLKSTSSTGQDRIGPFHFGHVDRVNGSDQSNKEINK